MDEMQILFDFFRNELDSIGHEKCLFPCISEEESIKLELDRGSRASFILGSYQVLKEKMKQQTATEVKIEPSQVIVSNPTKLRY